MPKISRSISKVLWIVRSPTRAYVGGHAARSVPTGSGVVLFCGRRRINENKLEINTSRSLRAEVDTERSN